MHEEYYKRKQINAYRVVRYHPLMSRLSIGGADNLFLVKDSGVMTRMQDNKTLKSPELITGLLLFSIFVSQIYKSAIS